MLDLIIFFDILLKILLIVSFSILLVFQIIQAQEKKLQNYYFILALIFGLLATAPYLLDPILWEAIIDEGTKVSYRIFLQSTSITIYAIFFYLWYKHYEAIYSLEPMKEFKWENYALIFLTVANVIIYLLHFLGFFPWDFLQDLFEMGLMPDFLIGGGGRIVTYLTHIGFFIGILAYGLILYNSIKFNLLELNKVSLVELIVIILLFITNILLFVNDVLLTLNLYGSLGPVIAAPIVTGLTFLLLLGLIFLIFNYMVFNPRHILSPSINREFYDKLNNLLDSDNKTLENKKQIPDKADVDNFDLKKLNSTSIELLIYLLRHSDEGTYARSMETDLQLNKATVSYNLRILEENSLIDRFESLQENDMRFKRIKINETGLQFLMTFHSKLSNYFY
jgi:DNA-binding MarR family transcriptional regulator